VLVNIGALRYAQMDLKMETVYSIEDFYRTLNLMIVEITPIVKELFKYSGCLDVWFLVIFVVENQRENPSPGRDRCRIF
jgi:hypothetical protein